VHKGTAELVYAKGGEGEPLEALAIVGRASDGVIGQAFASGRIVEVLDYSSHEGALPDRKEYIKSLTILPLRFEGEELGAVVKFTHSAPHPGLRKVQLQELRILQSLLRSRVALRRAKRLWQRSRGLVAFMDEIHKINRLDELVPVLFKSLSRDVEYNAVAVNFVEGSSLRILYGVGDSRRMARTIGEAIVPFEEETLTYHVLSSSEPLLIGDMNDPIAKQKYPVRTIDTEPKRDAKEFRSFLGVPFKSRSIRGVISLQSERPLALRAR